MRKKKTTKEQFLQLMEQVATEFEHDPHAQSERLFDERKPAGSEPCLVMRLGLKLYEGSYKFVYKTLGRGYVVMANEIFKNRYGMNWGNIGVNLKMIHEREGKQAAVHYFREIAKEIEQKDATSNVMSK